MILVEGEDSIIMLNKIMVGLSKLDNTKSYILIDFSAIYFQLRPPTSLGNNVNHNQTGFVMRSFKTDAHFPGVLESGQNSLSLFMATILNKMWRRWHDTDYAI